MNDVAIHVEKLGKLYQLGQREPYPTLRAALAKSFNNGIGRLKRVSQFEGRNGNLADPQSIFIWAIKDVSFEVKKGQTLGIIGPNGSGKSTLLKLLAQITEPTEGEIYVNGRLTALIELGAGFHPELTGRENIYLYGAILGLKKKEVDSKFRAIVDFAELGDFIDTPVKRYSTGMSVRLGFAVAVSAEPEILLVDEVLSVGDAAFRQRCFARIDSFIKAKKTLIFVSHNLHEIQRITRRVILLNRGLVHAQGSPTEVIPRYGSLVAKISSHKEVERGEQKPPENSPRIEIVGIDLSGSTHGAQILFKTHEELQVRVRYVAHQAVANPVFRVQIYRTDGLFCHGMNTGRHGIKLGRIYGEGSITLRYRRLSLLEGDYSFQVAVLATELDDLPIHQMGSPYGIHVESQKVHGGGLSWMDTEWIVSNSVVREERLLSADTEGE